MKRKPTVRAIDVGYGNVKFTVDETLQARLFPSLAPRRHQPMDDAGLALRERRTVPIHIDDAIFEVGPDTALFDELPVLHRDYANTLEYRALMYGAFDAMQVPTIDFLVLGLPVHLHASRAARLKELFTGQHMIRPGRYIDVKEVMVVHQPLGGHVAHNNAPGQWEAAREQSVLLIDPGYFTFDWMVTRNMQEVPGLSGGVECGMADYLNATMSAINWDLGECFSKTRLVDRSLRSKQPLSLAGRTVDLAEYQAAAAPVVSRAIKSLRNCVRNPEEISSIWMVGGGAEYFREAIASEFRGIEVGMVGDPVFANVTGFHMIGDLMAGRRSAA